MRWGLTAALCGVAMLAGCGGSSPGGSNQPAPTLPPKANPGGPYTGAVGTPVAFNGGGSSDPQGQALTFVWNFGDGSVGTGVTTSHTYAQVAGATSSTYAVSVTVTDTVGLSAQQSTTATIQGIAPLVDVKLTGVVSSGLKPISGARVYLLAASTTSGQPSVSLVSAAETATSDSLGAYVTTDSFGNFSMSGDYTCSIGQQLYIYALGGTSGAGATTASGLMAAIGSCPGFTASAILVTVNEVSTVAAAYAIAAFATDATHVSSSGTALAQVGVTNAFANAANLATLSTGVALAATPAGIGTVPQTEVNTLANILAACVEAGDPKANACGLLFSNALAGGSSGASPGDTASAAINIAHNPSVNATSLFQIPASPLPYTPALATSPNDFTISITFTGGGLSGPQCLAIDGSGNAWITDFANGGVTELSSLGVPAPGSPYTGNGLDTPFAIAIDAAGNAWIANNGSNSVTEISSTGSFVSGASGYTGGGLGRPRGIAIDGLGNAWIANYGSNSVTKLSSTGAAAPGSPYSGGGLSGPFGIAIDGSGNAWIANNSGDSVTQLSSSGAAVSGSPYTGGGLLSPVGVTVDGPGNVWVTNNGTFSVTRLSNSGAMLSGTNGYQGGGVGMPYGIAIDGAGNSWIASENPFLLTELSPSDAILSGPNGYSASGLNLPTAIAVDGSGDVWVANNAANTVSEFVGVATAVVTPIVAGLPAKPTTNGTSKLGTQP